MRRLIAITTLGLVLSSSVSFASDYMGTYTKPIVRSEVRNDINGGNVEKDFTSFYTSSKLTNTPESLTPDQKTDDQHISIFGVQISLR